MIDPMFPRHHDLLIIAGFHDPSINPRHGDRKALAKRIRIRIAAVELAAGRGLRAPNRDIADRVGISDRNLGQLFKAKKAMLRFPPPELATALLDVCSGVGSWDQIPERARVLFEALEGNAEGRSMMAGLAELHERHSSLRVADGYFAEELRTRLQERSGPLSGYARCHVGFITEALRFAFTEWAVDSTRPTTMVWEILASKFATLPKPDLASPDETSNAVSVVKADALATAFPRGQDK